MLAQLKGEDAFDTAHSENPLTEPQHAKVAQLVKDVFAAEIETSKQLTKPQVDMIREAADDLVLQAEDSDLHEDKKKADDLRAAVGILNGHIELIEKRMNSLAVPADEDELFEELPNLVYEVPECDADCQVTMLAKLGEGEDEDGTVAEMTREMSSLGMA